MKDNQSLDNQSLDNQETQDEPQKANTSTSNSVLLCVVYVVLGIVAFLLLGYYVINDLIPHLFLSLLNWMFSGIDG